MHERRIRRQFNVYLTRVAGFRRHSKTRYSILLQSYLAQL